MCNQPGPLSIGNRVPSSCRVFALVLVPPLAMAARAADQPASPPPQPVLHLADGRSLPGEIRASTRPGVLRWQAASAGMPSEFAWKEVSAIHWPPPATPARPAGAFRFELAAGDVLFGSLLALDDQRAELDVPRLGRVHVRRSHLHRIGRWRDGADLVHVGPNGLAGWHEPKGQNKWRDDSGRPTTDREDASIRGNFGLPDRASIEFEISWKTRPDFVFALGVDDTANSVKRAFRFEVWSADFVIQRETEREADLAVVQEVSVGHSGRVHLEAYLDQARGRILVFSPGGQQLADLRATDARAAVLPGLYLENARGDVRLEWLRIGRWDGEIPGEVPAGQARIRRDDGSTLVGDLTGLDTASKDFLVKTETGESRVSEDHVSSVFLPVTKEGGPRLIRAVFQDGSRVSGELVKVEDGVLTLTVPGIEEPLRLPLAVLRSVVVLRR